MLSYTKDKSKFPSKKQDFAALIAYFFIYNKQISKKGAYQFAHFSTDDTSIHYFYTFTFFFKLACHVTLL